MKGNVVRRARHARQGGQDASCRARLSDRRLAWLDRARDDMLDPVVSWDRRGERAIVPQSFTGEGRAKSCIQSWNLLHVLTSSWSES